MKNLTKKFYDYLNQYDMFFEDYEERSVEVANLYNMALESKDFNYLFDTNMDKQEILSCINEAIDLYAENHITHFAEDLDARRMKD